MGSERRRSKRLNIMCGSGYGVQPRTRPGVASLGPDRCSAYCLAPDRGAAYFSRVSNSDTKPPVKYPSEPILNVPSVVAGIVGALVLVHGLRTLLLTPDQDFNFLLEFAFIPARYSDIVESSEALPGGWGADVWTFVTHAFIHADVIHLGVNIAWLLPFGSAVARRFGPVRFLGLFAVASAAGAGAHLVTHWGEQVALVGASGGISGLMAAAIRFAFQRGGPLHLWSQRDFEAYRVPAASLVDSLRDVRVLAFLAVWFGLNLLFGMGTVSMPGVEQTIAWQAHIGGFVAGLLLFKFFDPVTDRGGVQDR
jgi:membrane associated rhomboid family serine protease